MSTHGGGPRERQPSDDAARQRKRAHDRTYYAANKSNPEKLARRRQIARESAARTRARPGSPAYEEKQRQTSKTEFYRALIRTLVEPLREELRQPDITPARRAELEQRLREYERQLRLRQGKSDTTTGNE